MYVCLKCGPEYKRCGWNSKHFNGMVEYLNPRYCKMADLNYTVVDPLHAVLALSTCK